MIEGLIRGDSIIFEAKAGEDITNWKIRCEIFDSSLSIKKATANSGGNDNQILINKPTEGVFLITINAGETTNFEDQSNIEIEMENTSGEIWTVFQSILNFTLERITWSTP